MQKVAERNEQTLTPSQLVTELTYDLFGNVTLERTFSAAAGEVLRLEKETVNEYINDTENWILGLPTRQTKRSGRGRLEDIRMYYDNLPYGKSSLGLQSKQEKFAFTDALLDATYKGVELPTLPSLGYHKVEAQGDAEYWFTVNETLCNARGDLIRSTDPLGKHTLIEYDSSGLYPIRISNPAGHIFQATYDERLGAISSLTDPNRQITRYRYTPLGRLHKEVKPGDSMTLPTLAYDYQNGQLAVLDHPLQA